MVNHENSLLLGLLIAFLTSCASYTDQTKQLRDAYRAERYNDALKLIDDSGLAKSSGGKLLYLLEKASIEDRLDHRADSRQLFLKADKLADELLTMSISREAATYVYNETAQDYPGEDYEKVGIHTMLALSFLEDGNQNAAQIEARKINSRLDELNGKYDEKAKNRYSMDAFALYVSGSIHESRGSIDDAIIDYKKAINVYDQLYSRLFGVGVPRQLVLALVPLLEKRNRSNDLKELREKFKDLPNELGPVMPKAKGKVKADVGLGEVLIFIEKGMISTKVAHDFPVPVGRQIMRISFPTITPKSYARPGDIVLQGTGGSFKIEPELVQNWDEIAAKTLEDRRTRLILKTGGRLLTKGAITEQAYRTLGPIGGIAANVYSAVTETADTRSWTLMPGAFFAARQKIPAGKYEMSVGAKDRQEIVVAPEKLVIVRAKPQN